MRRATCRTLAVAWAVQKTIGLRVDPDTELRGLDTVVHAETAYEHGGLTG